MIRCWHSCEGLGLPLDKTWTRLGLGLGTIQTSSPPADCTKQLLLQARQLLAKNTLGLSLSLDLCVSFSLGLHLVCTKQLILQTRQLLVNTTLGLGLDLGVGFGVGLVCTKQPLLKTIKLLFRTGLALGLDLIVGFGLGIHLVCTKHLPMKTYHWKLLLIQFKIFEWKCA